MASERLSFGGITLGGKLGKERIVARSLPGVEPFVQAGAAAVQARNRALLLYDLDLPLASGKEVPIVAPSLLLPAHADGLWVNGREADRRAGPHALSAGDVLYLQEGGVYASLRFVPAPAGLAGYAPTYHYRLDGRYELKTKGETGRGRRVFHVGALACVLHNGGKTVVEGREVRAGFVVEMATA